jgi:hypothetical protein
MKDDQDLASSLLAHDEDVAVPADHERRIREGLAALLGGGAPPAPSNPTTPGNGAAQSALRKWATTAVVAAAAAGGGFVAGRVTSPPAAPPQPVVVAPPPAPAASSPSAPSVEPVAPTAPSASTSATTPPTAVPAAPGADGFDREQSLLERARSALVRHDADAAQKALDEHDRQFPRSRHAEERDYLRIQVLRERGDGARVRERAKAFLAKYPDSMLRARVEPLAE